MISSPRCSINNPLTTCDLLTQCARLLVQSQFWPEASPQDTARILTVLHQRGMLYVMVTAQQQVIRCAGVYQTPTWEEPLADVIPLISIGPICYVLFACADSSTPWGFVTMLKAYERAHPEVTDWYWHSRHSDTNLIHRQRHHQEVIHVQEKETDDYTAPHAIISV